MDGTFITHSEYRRQTVFQERMLVLSTLLNVITINYNLLSLLETTTGTFKSTGYLETIIQGRISSFHCNNIMAILQMKDFMLKGD